MEKEAKPARNEAALIVFKLHLSVVLLASHSPARTEALSSSRSAIPVFASLRRPGVQTAVARARRNGRAGLHSSAGNESCHAPTPNGMLLHEVTLDGAQSRATRAPSWWSRSGPGAKGSIRWGIGV